MGEQGDAPSPGSYADPAGTPGRLRYWDGRQWSADTQSARPVGSTSPGSAGAHAPARPWRRGGILLIVGCLVVVIIVIISFLIRHRADPGAPHPNDTRPKTSVPTQKPAGLTCDEPDNLSETDYPTPDGRVHSGRMSYPRLTAPFDGPTSVTLLRYTYVKELKSQFATLRYKGESTGGAEVLVSRLPLVDGLPNPRRVAEFLFDCERGKYPGAEETRHRSTAVMVHGHHGWLIREHIGYAFGKVEAGIRDDTLIIEVVATTETENGLFYARLPSTHPQLVPKAEAAMKKLTVS